MRITVPSLLHYYRNSLADADRMSPEESWIQTALKVSISEWESGQLHPETVNSLWAARTQSGKAEIDEWGRRRVWYCPWVGTLKPEHGAQKTGLPIKLVPLWFPLRISEAGTIEPDPVLLPWIPRNLMSPLYPARMVIGEVADADTYMAAVPWVDPEPDERDTPTSHRKKRIQAWFLYGYRLLEYVSKQYWESFNVDEYYRDDEAIVLPAGAPSARISGLIAHYDALIKDKITTPPLVRYALGDTFPKEDPLAYDDDPRALHIAHIPGMPQLSDDQRFALHKALVHHPDVLAVNGPPGTGKTRWVAELSLQAIVQSALDGETQPPIQIWLANSNQAVINMLNTLQTGLEGTRWGFPEVNGLGLWCAAKTARELSNDIPWAGYRWENGLPEGAPARLGSEESVIQAKLNIEYEAKRYWGEHLELPDIKDRIKAELTKYIEPLQTTWRLLARDRVRKQKVDSLLKEAQWTTEFDEFLNNISALHERRKKALTRARYILTEWLDHCERTPLWHVLTAMLPGAQVRAANRNKEFFKRFNIVPRGADMTRPETVTASLRRLITDIENLYKQTERHWISARKLKLERDEVGKLWASLSERWIETPRWYDDGSVSPDWENRCDTVLRAEALRWAVRYWEVVFVEKRISFYKNTKQQRWRMDGWNEIGCLMPMLIGTLHAAPRHFCDPEQYRPFYSFAERIIIEEASQVSPELVFGLLSFAKSAVFVGDTEQLSPIWNVPEKTDVGNMLQLKLIESEDELMDMRNTELPASSGCALKRANQVGLSVALHEQHRSHPDLVEFANRLAYGNSITPTRPILNPEQPAFSYGHIIGHVDTQWGSKSNRVEALATAQYILKIAPDVKAAYNTSKLSDVMGIITPFVRQAQLIKQELAKRLPPEDIPTIGTVHAYQGTEKNIIVFSAVQPPYGQEIAFYDTDNRMLNVAVSRARDSFWFIGNMNGLTSRGLKPSAILAQSLIKGNKQRLDGWLLPHEQAHDLPIEVPGDNSEQRRDDTLREFVDEAQGQLHIASPWVDLDVLERINFWALAKKAIDRGASITIHANKPIMTYNGNSNASEILKAAALAGVKWEWYEALYDSRIWQVNRMAESSSPWLAPLANGNFYTHNGPVNLWCMAQMGSWMPIKNNNFGQKDK